MIDDKTVSQENILAYIEIYKIEVGLRELLINKLGEKDPRWWKHRLPPDVLKKYREGKTEEKKIKWYEIVPHHPLYYIDFTDLRKIIEIKDNWRDVFQEIFYDKEVVCAMLRKIEPIRNKIAHNRLVSHHDLKNIETVYLNISTSVGKSTFEGLIQNLSIAYDLVEILKKLKQEAIRLYELCKSIKPLDKIEVWNQVEHNWWFDDDYLGNNIKGITGYFGLLIEYSKLPRFRGSGYKTEEWINKNDVDRHYNIAVKEIDEILAGDRG